MANGIVQKLWSLEDLLNFAQNDSVTPRNMMPRSQQLAGEDGSVDRVRKDAKNNTAVLDISANNPSASDNLASKVFADLGIALPAQHGRTSAQITVPLNPDGTLKFSGANGKTNNILEETVLSARGNELLTLLGVNNMPQAYQLNQPQMTAPQQVAPTSPAVAEESAVEKASTDFMQPAQSMTNGGSQYMGPGMAFMPQMPIMQVPMLMAPQLQQEANLPAATLGASRPTQTNNNKKKKAPTPPKGKINYAGR